MKLVKEPAGKCQHPRCVPSYAMHESQGFFHQGNDPELHAQHDFVLFVAKGHALPNCSRTTKTWVCVCVCGGGGGGGGEGGGMLHEMSLVRVAGSLGCQLSSSF